MTRTRVKICGITRPDDARAAALAGADAIGVVFVPSSRRHVDPEHARAVIAALPPLVAAVGLFQDAAHGLVHEVLENLALGWLQFHGDEDPAYCASFGRPYLKAVPMGAGADVADYARRFAGAAGLLLDSHGGTRSGGSGETFDWDAIPRGLAVPLVLAGGLGPHNVADAVQRVRPWAVDVSSGVEAAKGIKDAAKLAAFMQGVRDGDSRG